VLTVVTFWPVLKHEFLKYDDDKYITDNPHVKDGITIKSIVWAFTTPHFFMWHPLTSLSHLLDYELFISNPFGHHLTNLLLHIANVLLVFLVLRSLTNTIWPSAFVAAVFAVHPLQVESVAWIAERKNVLSTFFWLLTIAAYIRYAKRPAFSKYLLLVLAFSLGLLAKPMVVTLPFVLLLLDFWPLERFHQTQNKSTRTDSLQTCRPKYSALRLVVEKIPLFALSAVVSVITYIAVQRGGVVSALESIPFSYRVANVVISYATYIEKLIWPSRLAVFYPHPAGNFSVFRLVVSAAILALISIYCIYAFNHRKYLLVGWLLFLGTLIPVIGLVQAGAQARADRYMYVPMLGLLIMSAWGIADLAAKWRYKKPVLLITTILALSALTVSTRLQLRHWQNSFTLFEHTLSVTSDNYVMHNNYANLLRQLGKIDQAIDHYTKGLQLRNDLPETHNNLANALVSKGLTNEAIDHYKKAIELARNTKHQRLQEVQAEAHYNLANLLRLQGQLQQALDHYTVSLKMKPDNADALHGLGLTLSAMKRFDEAIDCFNKLLKLQPDNVIAHGLLGLALAQQGKNDEAITEFRIVLSRRPDDVEMSCNLGILLEQQGKTNEAINQYRKALEVNPSYDKARQLLDAALAKQGSQKTGK
jgi:tetratricopeptide (TPR) repeat protein